MSFSFALRKTASKTPSLPYGKVARHILGPHYELSLVVCGDKLATTMNARYRKKTYSPNVLSFPYSRHDGEIFLNARKAVREARTMGTSARARMALLFVHGCLHLKGYRHGVTMERLEQTTLRKFGLN